VLVYAEGTTTVERNTGVFKIGTFKAATTLGVPVVPIAIEYRDSKDYWLADKLSDQMIGQVGTGSTHVKIYIGKSLSSDNPKNLLSELLIMYFLKSCCRRSTHFTPYKLNIWISPEAQ